jgi:nitroreductase
VIVHLNLSADEVLTTTRAVRRRLDFTRPVEKELIRECLEIALQAPTGSNRQNWHFLVITDPAVINQVGELYQRAIHITRQEVSVLTRIDPSRPEHYEAQNQRVQDASVYLADNMHRVPAMLIPCIEGDLSTAPGSARFSMMGSVIQAAWSFMLAARNRGIGTVWTTVHTSLEAEAAQLLGIPYPAVTQVALIPFGYSIGTDFKRATREPLDRVLHWDHW